MNKEDKIITEILEIIDDLYGDISYGEETMILEMSGNPEPLVKAMEKEMERKCEKTKDKIIDLLFELRCDDE